MLLAFQTLKYDPEEEKEPVLVEMNLIRLHATPGRQVLGGNPATLIDYLTRFEQVLQVALENALYARLHSIQKYPISPLREKQGIGPRPHFPTLNQFYVNGIDWDAPDQRGTR